MPVTVRLSAGLARLAGLPRLTLVLAEGTTVAGLLQHLAGGYPALTPHVGMAIPIIRGSPAGSEQILVSGDEVALLVPVAGG